MFSNSDRFSYFSFGLNIDSSIRIPDLVVGGNGADITIRFGELSEEYLDSIFRTPVLETPGCRVRVAEKAMSFDWPIIGKFLITEGCEVVVEPASAAQEEDLMPFLTGPAMIVLLHQRGNMVLHASCVQVDGIAVAFLGAKGFGKSTLAACMYARGHSLISDDIVPVYFSDGKAFTLPGYPRIKLYPDSVVAAGRDPSRLPYIHRLIEKHSFACPNESSVGPVELGAIYILDKAEAVRIDELDMSTTFIELITNTHAGHHLARLNSQERHFRQCQELVRTIPSFRMSRPHRFSEIDEVCQKLERHISGLNHSKSSPRVNPAVSNSDRASGDRLEI
ncbi:MAG: hypothetical protein R2682_03620 [Pyrinomonadaceae bacterium]